MPDYDPNSIRNLIVCRPNQLLQLLINIHNTEEIILEYSDDKFQIRSFYGRLDSMQVSKALQGLASFKTTEFDLCNILISGSFYLSLKEFKAAVSCCDSLYPQIDKIYLYFDKGGTPLLISTSQIGIDSDLPFSLNILIATSDVNDEDIEMYYNYINSADLQGAEFQLTSQNIFFYFIIDN